MTNGKDDTGGDIFALVLSVLAIAGTIFLLWAFGVVRDWTRGGIAAGAVVLYVVAAYFVFPIASGEQQATGRTIRDAERTLGRAIAYYGLMPGHLIAQMFARSIGRLFGKGS